MQQQQRQKVICRTAEAASGQKYFQSQLVGTNLDELSQVPTPNHKYTLGVSHIPRLEVRRIRPCNPSLLAIL